MKILLIAENVCAFKDANGNCIWNIANELRRVGHEVHLLSTSYRTKDLKKEQIEDIFCHWLYTPWKYPAAKIKHEALRKPFSSLFRSIAKVYNKLYLSKQNKNTIVKSHEIRLWKNSIKRALCKYKFDKIIICFYPIEPVLAYCALKEQNNDLPSFWVYQLDAYVDNGEYTPTGRDARIRLLKKTFGKAEGIFTTPLLKNSLIRILPDQEKQIVPLEFPLLVEHPHNKQYEKHSDGICGVYAGSLYQEIRRPDFMLRLLSATALTNLKIYLFVTNSLHAEQVHEWKMLAKNIQVEFLKGVTFDEMMEIMDQADFLINIGNKVANQLPSKIIDYIAAGKPILNIVQVEGCPTLRYLDKYERALSISTQDNLEAAANRCRRFIESSISQEVISFSRIKKVFQDLTPEHITQTILQYIK